MAQKEMRIDKPYLNLPVRPDAPIAWVNWERPDGGLLYELYAELDFDDPAYYVPCHVERWMGETLRLRIDAVSEERLVRISRAPGRNGRTTAGRGCILPHSAASWGIPTACSPWTARITRFTSTIRTVPSAEIGPKPAISAGRPR